MKPRFLSIISILLSFAMLLGCTGCGNEAAQEKPEATAEPEPEYRYVSETVMTMESSKENALAAEPAFFTDDGYYAIGGRFDGQQIPEGATAEYEGQFDVRIPCISFVSLDGTVTELPAFRPVMPEETDGESRRDYMVSSSIEKLFSRPDGRLEDIESLYVSWSEAEPDVKYGTEKYYESFQSESSWYLRVLDTDGSEISRAKLKISEEDAGSFYSSAMDSAGNFLMYAGNGLIAFREDGEEAYRIPVNGYVYSIAALKDGRTAVLVYDFGTNVLEARIVDPEAGDFGSGSYKMNYNVSALISGAGDYDLYYNGGSSFYGYTLENGTEEKLFSWMDCDLSANSLNKISVLSDGAIAAFSYDYDEKAEILTTELVSVKRVPYEQAAEKTHLRLATLYASDNLQEEIIRFNRKHDDVHIDLDDYYEFNTVDDYTVGYTKLITEIAAGNVPDILDMSVDLPYRQFAAKGLLEDLYPYIDADEEFSREDFFPNVMAALDVNGGIYMTCSGFAVYTAVGASSVVGEGPGITYDRYYEALASMPEGCEGFDVGASRESMLEICMALELEDLMDWNTGECHFDTPEFIEMLEYLKGFPAQEKLEDLEYTSDDSAAVRVAEGKQMLAVTVCSSVDYMLSDYDSMFGGQASMVGFPTNHGVGNMIAVISGLAISSKCRNKDAAWEFVRTYLTEDFQEDDYYIPSNVSVFNERLKEAMTPKYETDANGNYRLDENGERIPVCIGSTFDGLNEIKIYSLSEAQGEMLKKAIADSTRMLNYDESINKIVLEGAQAFFAGQKTAEEAAKLIQSKASIYVNEQR